MIGLVQATIGKRCTSAMAESMMPSEMDDKAVRAALWSRTGSARSVGFGSAGTPSPGPSTCDGGSQEGVHSMAPRATPGTRGATGHPRASHLDGLTRNFLVVAHAREAEDI
eukprot:scaffold55459_cov30-Tisochrysis_lutea.AAC.1